MRRLALVQDCARCAAVCCIATSFSACTDFAFSKAAATPCQHLEPDFRCGIYADREARGCKGCELFTCYGAGPRATELFAGADMTELVTGFESLLSVCEMIWLLTEAQRVCPSASSALIEELGQECDRLRAIAAAGAQRILQTDPARVQQPGRALLLRVGAALGGRAARS